MAFFSNQKSLIKHELNERFIKLYFYQLINDGYVFSEVLQSKAEQLYGEISIGKLEELSREQIKALLGDHFVKDVFLFSTDLIINCLNTYSLDNLLANRKIAIPELYTGIKQVSEDSGGLVILEAYNVQLLELYTKDGKHLIEPCSDLELGANGTVYYRLNDSIFWEKGQVRIDFESEFLSDDYDYKQFPFIDERDNVATPLSADDFPNEQILETEHFKQYTNHNPETLPSLRPLYAGNKELAKIAVLKDPLLFSLLDDHIQNDRNFVLSVLSECEDPESIYRFVPSRLKADREILQIMNLPHTGTQDDTCDDDLPF